MGIMINHYQILGVSHDASFDEIKKAYRGKVKSFHPDKKSGNADVFKRIKEAYEILKNPEKRKIYDELLFKKSNYHMNDPKQSAPSKMNPTIATINIRRKSPKVNSLSSLTFNATLILIGTVGKIYINRRKKK